MPRPWMPLPAEEAGGGLYTGSVVGAYTGFGGFMETGRGVGGAGTYTGLFGFGLYYGGGVG